MTDGIIVVGNMMAFHGDMVVYKCGTNEVWKTIEDSDFICPDGSWWYCAKDRCTYQRSYCKAIPYIPLEGCGGADIKIGEATVSHCEYELDEVIENCTVEILKCRNCGNVSIGWRRDDYEGT